MNLISTCSDFKQLVPSYTDWILPKMVGGHSEAASGHNFKEIKMKDVKLAEKVLKGRNFCA